MESFAGCLSSLPCLTWSYRVAAWPVTSRHRRPVPAPPRPGRPGGHERARAFRSGCMGRSRAGPAIGSVALAAPKLYAAHPFSSEKVNSTSSALFLKCRILLRVAAAATAAAPACSSPSASRARPPSLLLYPLHSLSSTSLPLPSLLPRRLPCCFLLAAIRSNMPSLPAAREPSVRHSLTPTSAIAPRAGLRVAAL
ncbi:hypothetical protein BDY17DRAFT_110506 [Neohortaea acidophila]|uniref:Uncharacterized protein n=1 Tax=Neohortaea acidophila TaxID=245834 RepID=A0A6A6Q2R5_9PEZI|nr:uncharacterized protein BDY17DRAFT_110506 [Neohortaea acidophila]KAF2485717.1 hypothetical protein BDY17DRAFT_110506 [Neohortaea acidophila]